MNRSAERGGLRNIKLIPENQTTIANEDGTITVHIPISFKRHGGRKYIIAPEGTVRPPEKLEGKTSLLRAIGRAFAWQAMLDSDPALTQDMIGKKEGFGRSYVSRVMRLTMLAPDIVEAIIDGRHSKYLRLADLENMPIDWNEQREVFGAI